MKKETSEMKNKTQKVKKIKIIWNEKIKIITEQRQ